MHPSPLLQIKVTLRSLSSDTTNLPAEIRRIATASSFGRMDGTKDTDWIWLGRGKAPSPLAGDDGDDVIVELIS